MHIFSKSLKFVFCNTGGPVTRNDAWSFFIASMPSSASFFKALGIFLISIVNVPDFHREQLTSSQYMTISSAGSFKLSGWKQPYLALLEFNFWQISRGYVHHRLHRPETQPASHHQVVWTAAIGRPFFRWNLFVLRLASRCHHIHTGNCHRLWGISTNTCIS